MFGTSYKMRKLFSMYLLFFYLSNATKAMVLTQLCLFVFFKGRSGYRGLPRFPLCLMNWISICRVPKKVVSSLHTAGVYEKPGLLFLRYFMWDFFREINYVITICVYCFRYMLDDWLMMGKEKNMRTITSSMNKEKNVF